MVSHGQKARRDLVGVDPAGEQADWFGQQRSQFESELIGSFVRRWSMETTFALVRTHLGRSGVLVETQRQWSELTIGRTTPVLVGLFSLVTLLANSFQKRGQLVCQVSSWYSKEELTFSDALTSARRYLWRAMIFCTSEKEVVHVKMSQQQYRLWQNALAWAA